MARKVYTVELDDKNIVGTKGSKSAKVASNESEKETSAFGIVEINNNSAKGKVKNLKDAGFEKNVTGSEKKAVKSTISQVEDYFDFSFRPVAREEVAVQEKKTCAKKVVAKKTATKKAEVVEVSEKIETKKANIVEEVSACQTYTMSDEARRVVSVARAGSLFG